MDRRWAFEEVQPRCPYCLFMLQRPLDIRRGDMSRHIVMCDGCHTDCYAVFAVTLRNYL